MSLLVITVHLIVYRLKSERKSTNAKKNRQNKNTSKYSEFSFNIFSKCDFADDTGN